MPTLVSTCRSLTAVFTVLLTAAALAFAAPKAPVEFDAKVLAKPGSTPTVLLAWNANRDGDAATSFSVYMASGETEAMADFTLVGTVRAMDNGTPARRYEYVVQDIRPGVYTFFIRASNDDGESDRTRIRVVRIEEPQPEEPRVTFRTEPKRGAEVGTAYRYDADAVANVDGDITYSLYYGPDGMVIVPETGVIEWEPTKAGRYEVKIKAVIVVDGVEVVAYQAFVIEVKGEGDDNPGKRACVYVGGTVNFDETNNLVMMGSVSAWRVDVRADDDSIRNGGKDDGLRAIYRAPIKQSTYMMEIPAGSYKFVAEGPGFYTEWYENAESATDAAVQELACNTRNVVNFRVAARPEPKVYTVSGRITDETSGEGLRGLVVFDGVKDAANDREHVTFRIETNAEGTYQIRLPEGIAFTAMAMAAGREGANRLYLPEYWEETPDPAEATVLNLTANVDGVNFTLAKRPTYENSLAGTVKNADASLGLPARVTAYLVTDSTKRPGIVAVYTVLSDTNGVFGFTNLEPGEYVISAHPGIRPYVAGWYVDGAEAAFGWGDATRITVGETSAIVDVTVRLRKGDGEGRGKGRVRGWVNRGHRKGDGPESADLVLSGSVIYAIDATGTVVDWTTTNADGSYELGSLGIERLTIRADRFGYSAAVTTVAIDAARNAEVEASFTLADNTTSVDLPAERSATSYNLYPNPANTSATVQFPSVSGTATVDILATTGVVFATSTVDVDGGLARVALPMQSLPAGSYIVRISNGARTTALPLMIVR